MDTGNEPRTEGNDAKPAGTDATPAPATQTDSKPAATDQTDTSGPKSDNDTVVLSKKDHAALVAARDKNFEAAKSGDERVAQLEYDFYKGKAVDQMVKDYPDVPKEVFDHADSPEQMKGLAEVFQKHSEKAKQDALKDLTTVGKPTISAEDKATKLKALENTGRLEDAIDLMLS